MKAKHIKIANRSAEKLPCSPIAFITLLLLALILIATIESSFADSATWIATPPPNSGDWNDAANWSMGGPPNGSADTATFASSDVTDVFFTANTEVNGIVFNPGADAFIIRVDNGLMLTVSGDGIRNNSGMTQNFATFLSGSIRFTNSATAGNARITNNGGGDVGLGGSTTFQGSSDAGNARITNGGGEQFRGGGSTTFQTSSNAANATITNDGGIDASGRGGSTTFQNSSTADNATITNDGGDGMDVEGGHTTFQNTSKADNATLIANGGSNGGSGGAIFFEDDSTGGTARVEVFGNGNLDISGHSTPGVTVGSIEGNGNVVLGANNLTVGSRNLPSTDFSGVISGLGGLTKVGSGTQTLSSENSYTGLTIVTAGTLAEGVSNAISTGDLTINGATAIFDLGANHSDSIGIVTLDGGGSITGTGTSTLTSTGSFEMKSGTVSAILDGSVALNKTTTGTVTLTGANTYTGATTVNAGSLIVDGSISSAQTSVNAGGLLGGNGIIGGDLTNGGIVSPGHSPGTLTVNRNYTQTANGTLLIEIAPGKFDLLAVGGHASLAGTLQLIRLGNFQLQVGDKITFLTAQGGVSGTFSTIQNPFISNTLVKAEIIYFPNAVQLEGTQGSFPDVACNPNTLAVAKALDSAVGDPRASGLIEFLDTQPLPELCPELELISPEELASMFNIGVSLANIQSVNLERRMEDIRAGSSGFSARGFSIDSRVPDFSQGLAGPTGPEGKSGPSVMQPTPQNRWGVFVTGLGEFTDVDSTSVARGYNFSTGGLTFGVDYRVSPNFAIGLTGGYANTNANLVNNGSLDVNGGTIGAYATGFGGGFYVDAAAFGVFNGYDSHRTALLGTASGDTDGQDFNALVVGGYDWKSGGLTIGPLASFQYTYVQFDSFTEHGSLVPLTFNDQNAQSSRTALGAKASYDWHVGHVVVKPELRASWQHEFGDRDYSIVSRFANGAGNSFNVNGPAIGRDSLLIGAGAAVLLNDRASVYAYYDGELARTNYSSNNVSAGFRVTF